MAAEAEVLDELHRLRARVPQLTGALAASVDGLVLAHDTPGVEPEGLAALTAAALGVAVRITDAGGRGDLRELLLRGEQGYVATYAAGASAVLTLLAQDRVNVGRLHLEGRRTGTRIGELVDASPRRAADPVPGRAASKAPADPTGRSPARSLAQTTPPGTEPTTSQTPSRATVRSTMPRRTPGATTSRSTPRTAPHAPTTSES
ncbi:roadblock/LC7 domain-containing protein [Streptomyces sp. NPDC008159]|uniref:roadblock/LC7 domain-containing protein n=1 Tax=Streptomyces sp. NPDC008159 TaxID=3364817 RepID=UPI0036E6A90D